ncbi:MAG: hypothetical protein RLZZ53_1147 [Acidobacteriota bacterium]|jgi:hypothetical protein
MSAIPNLKVPITVQTDQVAPAMRKVEREVSASAARMSKIRAAMQPALGAAGAGPLGGLIGGLGASGLGGAAIGIGAAILPFAGASRALDTLESNTRGAGAALEEFRKTGKQTFTGSAVMLERLAAIEQRMTARTTFGQAFAAGAGTDGNIGGLQTLGRVWNAAGAGLGGLVGSLTGQGTSVNEIIAQMQLQMASNEDEARRAQARFIFDRMERERIQRQAGITGMGPFSVARDLLGAVNRIGKAVF